MKSVLVTGGNGQLGLCIQNTPKNNQFNYIFARIEDLDITNLESVKQFFKTHDIAWCINCAAYTAVDKAEEDKTVATQVNATAPQYLAEICKSVGAKLIHVSTDFVFDGTHNIAYTETDDTNPLGVYGDTKLAGEKNIVNTLSEHFIIRTSWLYSEFANNFMKTMLRLAEDRDELSIVADQIGTPTYARDLAEVIVNIIDTNSQAYGTYHYSNEGVASWYDFATAIFEIANTNTKTLPIPSSQFPTPAKRPHFSVLDKTKIKAAFNITISHWRSSLKKAISRYNE